MKFPTNQTCISGDNQCSNLVKLRRSWVQLTLALATVLPGIIFASPFAPEFALDSISTTEGSKINATQEVTDDSTKAVAVGDVNGDGFGDYVVSFQVAQESLAAHSHYLIHNLHAGRDIYIGENEISAARGSILLFDNRHHVVGIGDYNGDNIDDWIAYRPFFVPSDPTTTARAQIIFGQSGGYSETLNVSSYDRNQSAAILANNNTYIDSIAAIGDFNGDGFDELVIETDDKLHLIFGGNNTATVELTALPSNQSIELDVNSARISGLGDVNGDGYDDFGIGYLFSEFLTVVYGNEIGLPTDITQSTLDGVKGISIGPTGEYLDGSDVNNDGYSDILVGRRGGAAVIYGSPSLPSFVDLDDLVSTLGYTVDNPDGDTVVSAAGDVNADGINDWMMGAQYYSDTSRFQGRVSVLYGSTDTVQSFSMDDLRGQAGFTVIGTEKDDFVGRTLAAVGDTNADSIDDMLFGTNNGTAFTLFGREDTGAPVSPTNLYAVFGAQSIDINWTQSTSSSVVRYEIFRATEFLGSVDNSESRFSDSSITKGDTYRYEVVAIDVFEQRSASVFIEASNTVTNFPVVGGLVYSDTAAEIFWAFGNGYYKVYRDDVLVFQGAAQSYFDDNFSTGGHRYFVEYIVSPCCVVDSPPVRSTILHLPEQAGFLPPAQPTNLRGDLYSLTALEIFWQRVERGSTVQRYEITLNGQVVGTTDGTSFFLDTGIAGLTELRFSVTAIGANGLRSGRSIYQFPLAAKRRAILPQAAYQSYAVGKSTTEIDLFWEAYPVGTTPKHYEIILDQQVIGTTVGTNFLVSDLRQPDQFYEFSIVGVGFDGNRSDPATVKAATLGGPLPATAPTALRYSPTVIELFWQRSAGVTRFVNYEIYRDGKFIASKDGTSFLDTGLLPGVTYTYTVVATTGTGDKQVKALPSEPVVITTYRL